MGIKTVAVYSEVDSDSPHVKLADQSVCIGEPESSKSYLNISVIIKVAKDLNCCAIHPGYGFLSENAKFSAACKSNGIIFIGPSAESIEAIGSKMGAKNLLAKEKDVPLIPGYNGQDQSLSTLKESALKIGFPILIKASAGGGGKGMRVVRKESDLESAIDSAKTEAKNSFGDDKVLIEKYFEGIRHIEIQMFGDTHGNVIHLFERECSVQRRHQKIIEESPSPVLPKGTREKMCRAAIKIGQVINYVGAGTVEFIYEEKSDSFFFLEVNTRLQVEHPVTECVTGLDLVKLQIEIARGKSLKDLIPSVAQVGHSIECRLYAEDPDNNFFPCPGKILKWKPHEIEGSRFDSGVENGSVISVYYDPMISKIITYGKDREEAINKMTAVLNKTIMIGIVTNKDFLVQLLTHTQFRAGNFDTMFIDNHFDLKKRQQKNISDYLIAAMLNDWNSNVTSRNHMTSIPSGFRNSLHKKQSKIYEYNKEKNVVEYVVRDNKFEIVIGGKTHDAVFHGFTTEVLDCSIDGVRSKFTIVRVINDVFIHSDLLGEIHLIKKSPLESKTDTSQGSSDSNILGDVPGKILKILVKNDDKVTKGQAAIVVESMKMENKRYASKDGTVRLFVKEGQVISADTLLITIE
jgi:acetyl/propionyl-CoA carboxylase alpha subunit